MVTGLSEVHDVMVCQRTKNAAKDLPKGASGSLNTCRNTPSAGWPEYLDWSGDHAEGWQASFDPNTQVSIFSPPSPCSHPSGCSNSAWLLIVAQSSKNSEKGAPSPLQGLIGDRQGLRAGWPGNSIRIPWPPRPKSGGTDIR